METEKNGQLCKCNAAVICSSSHKKEFVPEIMEENSRLCQDLQESKHNSRLQKKHLGQTVKIKMSEQK